MRVTTIGSGTGSPSATRVSSAHLVTAGNARILFDCGSGAVHRMAACGIDWMSITHLAITHFHPDHVSDIPTLFYAWRYGTLPFRTEPVTLIGPPGFRDFFARFDTVFGKSLLKLDFAVELHELEPESALELASGVVLESRRVPHSVESVAYSISAGGRRIVYTGDTAFDAALAEWAARCDLLLMECSLPEELAVPTHMTPQQCAEFAAIARPEALALTHFYPPVDRMDVAAIIAARYDGPVYLTYDGWTIEPGE